MSDARSDRPFDLHRPGPEMVTNGFVAGRLAEVAALLERQGANPFRVHAYRHAAATVRALDRPVRDIVATEGLDGLDRLPGIGRGLAASIRELVATRRLAILDRLRGESDPIALLASVPGIGERLARRLHAELDVDSLEGLEAAVYDGRLHALRGFGEKRIAAIRDTLAARLASRRLPAGAPPPPPPVGELLDVDHEYRTAAAAGTLHLITPRRHNPAGAAWLPVLHTERGARHYTALYSNTPRAHALRKTDDWVVIYSDGEAGERQATVVTETRGVLRGRRVVRGREPECVAHYRARSRAG